ncbi:MAG: hypothetical protein OSA89_18525, partial [Mariniblastus sp.]|nr:hypothetical protein [Mariniblastus sp.]
MTDELYDYFGGNASKKVEPIEDDEFENESETEGTSEEAVISADDSKNESNDAGVDVIAADASAADASAADTSGKKSGHWDFLANMLGISSSKKTATESEPVRAAPKVEAETAAVDEESGAEEMAEVLGLEPISSPEKSSVLSSMFTTGNDSESGDPEDDLIGWNPRPRKSFIAEAEESETESSNASDNSSEEVEVAYEEGYDDIEASDGEEVFEFEIEDLDPRPRTEEDDLTHGRRRRKPNRAEGAPDSSPDSSRDSSRDSKSSSRRGS